MHNRADEDSNDAGARVSYVVIPAVYMFAAGELGKTRIVFRGQIETGEGYFEGVES